MTTDSEVHPEDTLWVAMIVKDKIDTPQKKVNYIATTKASTETLAIHNIAKMQWTESYWVKGVSGTVIVSIHRANNPKIFATQSRVRRRRRG